MIKIGFLCLAVFLTNFGVGAESNPEPFPIFVAGTARPEKIFISWAGIENAIGYNVYRDDVPNKPLNVGKIVPITKNIKTIIPVNSEEWPVIKKTMQIAIPDQFFTPNLVRQGKVILDRDQIRWSLAQIYASAAKVMGLGYSDSYNLKLNQTYKYTVKAVLKNNQERPVGAPVVVVCRDNRNDMAAPGPQNISLYEGDQYLEMLWPVNDQVLGYDISRAEGSGNSFVKINTVPLVQIVEVPKQLPGGRLLYSILNPPLRDTTPTPWSGKYSYHYYVDQTDMDASPVVQVKNGTTYRYKITPRDILGPGNKSSSPVSLKPEDQLPPAAPKKLNFEVIEKEWELSQGATNPNQCICQSGSCAACPYCKPYLNLPNSGQRYKYNDGLKITWEIVNRNTAGCPEYVTDYVLYRYTSQEAAMSNDIAGRSEAGKIHVSSASTTGNKEVEDKGLKGETVYWYRLALTDSAGHTTDSAVFSASMLDKKPPLAPANVRIKAHDTQKITIAWDASNDSDNDLAGYRIYRKIAGAPVTKNGESFRLIGEVAKNVLEFTDQTLPEMKEPVASGLVYQYCVKAFDQSQNVSFNHKSNFTCSRLELVKGPQPPTITTLTSRSNSIRIDWVAPPVPNLYTFRIYRSEVDPAIDDTKWDLVSYDPSFDSIGYCHETPPKGLPYALGLKPKVSGKPALNEGTEENTYWFVDDKEVQSHKKYWYMVVSLDFWQHPAEGTTYFKDSASAVMSTFTYEEYVNDVPVLHAPAYDSAKGVTLTWDKPTITGVTYQVYRLVKTNPSGKFTLIAAGLTNTTYTDNTVHPGNVYQYKILFVVTATGRYSQYSNMKEIAVN